MVRMTHRWFLLGMLLVAGCTQTTPVEEISVKASGVSLKDTELPDLSHLWPGWRGPDRNGHVPDQRLPIE
ncbi:MAG TPA: serine/threonine protein kinase, partial [Planctomycetaceae bacterium]|nr:serine/threonine protein kinase [Planctomycetaceae bacterium]